MPDTARTEEEADAKEEAIFSSLKGLDIYTKFHCWCTLNRTTMRKQLRVIIKEFLSKQGFLN
jgi:hypothetical protein